MIPRFNVRLAGGALPYAILLSLLVSAMVGVLWKVVLTDRLMFNKLVNINQNMLDTESAMDLMCCGLPWDSSFVIERTELFPSQWVQLEHQQWGAFELLRAAANDGDAVYMKIFLCGTVMPDTSWPVLVLEDQGNPIHLSGNTRITGRVLGPQAGFKRASVNGRPFTGDRLIGGSQGQAPKTLHEPHQRLLALDRLEMLELFRQQDCEVLSYLPGKVLRSFADKPLVINLQGETVLDGVDLQGRIVVVSEEALLVTASSRLKDVILLAPTIYIQQGFSGRIQAIASDTIIVGQDCHLDYPSVLAIVQNTSSSPQPLLHLMSQSTIGGVMALIMPMGRIRTGLLQIDSGAIVTGMVHSEAYTQCSGTVHGRLLSRRLYLKTSSAVYENHLLDARIDGSQAGVQLPLPWVWALQQERQRKLYKICRVW